ncbi:TadE-like protein [Pseudomonas taetrolens]|uniref:Pilus assembly protein TadE n=1 Tax=Pseudomonas taetrolens TaxID=47884 RepID=A0A0J6GF80_PSETA|nr:TadE/TadG family type IV pilus assembly protein [Pseudomonas taetrolens]KMM83421.1 pilus assembly protein TadE [Pseudomonas taetrolens]SED53786.1 TadE-like protein [Pseudomonas taetrolens]SQF88135.1 pseudopilin TadF [Pseudomonas taetrolens]VEH51325.1 pseudopilin TadF [Pseudomonas taetrolens]
MKIGLSHKQKGAAAIEFALVFVIFFAVLYGVLSYSLPLLLMQSFNNATAEAARRSVAVDPTLAAAAYKLKVEEVAKAVLEEKLTWVPSAIKGSIVKTAAYNAGELVVTVSLPATALSSIMPVLKLGVITVPQLPTDLTAKSSLSF